ncbi:MAG: hypothetical protein AB7H77_03560 [Bdellovibrionales bacterium]
MIKDWQPHTTADILQLYSDTLEELRRREVLRSANNPSGDYGELLFSRAFGWQLQNNSSSGYDAINGDGVRYQIKCRRITPRNSSRQLSFIRNLPVNPFDILAGVLLDQKFKVLRAALVPVAVVQEKATYVKHVNAWRMILRDSVWDIPGVQDVTSELRAIEQSL